MRRTAQSVQDGSDTPGPHASTQVQRLAAFKKLLEDAVCIFDSLDPASIDQLKQDRSCKDLVQRLLPIVPTPPAPNVGATTIYPWQVVKSGLGKIVSNIARLSLPAGQGQPDGDVAVLKMEATIHFLRGYYRESKSEAANSIERLLSQAEGGRYTVLWSNRGYLISGFCLCLTSSPATDSFPSMISSLHLSPLWSEDAIVRIRVGGTVEYGFKIIVDEFKKTLFDLDHHLTNNRLRIYKDYLHSQPNGPWGPNDIFVSETVVAGMYILSGNSARLERLFADGEKKMELVVQRTIPGGEQRTDVYDTVFKPFRLYY